MQSWFFALWGCANEPVQPLAGDGSAPDCESETYPANPVEPMKLGQTLAPYRWPNAIDRRTGRGVSLDLALAPCDLDPEIDWSPVQALLFVSIPAW